MDANLAELKEVLFDILGGMYVSPDVQAVQQMGVNLTNSVKREGVVIIQNQNVEVYARMVPALVKCIRLCDLISQSESTRQIEYVEQAPEEEKVVVEVDALEAICKWLYENNTPWKRMQDMMKAAYLSYVMARLPSGVAAAKLLGVGPSYLSKILHDGDPSPAKLQKEVT